MIYHIINHLSSLYSMSEPLVIFQTKAVHKQFPTRFTLELRCESFLERGQRGWDGVTDDEIRIGRGSSHRIGRGIGHHKQFIKLRGNCRIIELYINSQFATKFGQLPSR